MAEETIPRCRSPARRPIQPTVAPGMYLLRRTRATQSPSNRKQYGMVKMTPCGKCLKVNNLMYLSPL